MNSEKAVKGGQEWMVGINRQRTFTQKAVIYVQKSTVSSCNFLHHTKHVTLES